MEGKIQHDELWLEQWRKGAHIDNAEPYTTFKDRVAQGVHQAISLPGPLLIVAHGAVYCALQEILGLPFYDAPNATPLYHRLQRDDNGNEQWTVHSCKKDI